MLIRIFALILMVMTILAVKTPEKSLRSYFIEKDFFNGLKMGEFSIYDSAKTHLLYRIESFFIIGGKLELNDTRNNKVIGKLGPPLSGASYKRVLSIFNSSSDNWTTGTIDTVFNMIHSKLIIRWNGRSLLMENKFGSLTTTFEYQYHSGILAKVKKRAVSLVWRNKYDLEIYSDQFPDALYFLALALQDTRASGRKKG